MKIMHILWGLKYGGAENMLVDIINRQCLTHAIEVVLINNNAEKDLLKQIDSSINITRINRPLKTKNFFYILKLNLHILFSRADIIHFHQENIIRYLPVRFLKRNLCLTVHGILMNIPEVKQFRFVFAISDKVKEEVLRKTGKEAVLVPNGVDIQSFNRKKEHNLDCFRIVQIGRLDHLYKGQHLTLMALHYLINNYNYTKIHLDIIGEGESEKYLKELTTNLNINAYVTFLGNCTKEFIRENLTYYELLVQPSLLEGFGLTIVEAMSAMTPTLISNVDGMQMISKNGELSYTFQSGDANDLAEKMIAIIRLPEMDKKALISKAYNYASSHFDIAVTANNYLKNYEMILSNTKKRKRHENSDT